MQVFTGPMSKRWILSIYAAIFAVAATAQQALTELSASTGASIVVGCLSGPDRDNRFTLTSMQHRNGVDVVCANDSCGEHLKEASGTKVRLTGTWETLPGREAGTGDSVRRFKSTDVAITDEKCTVPQAVAPISKRKQAQQKQSQQK